MKIRILFALALAAVALPAHAQPWRFEDIGSFRYRPRVDPITDRDRSEATAETAHNRLGGVPGFISWSCEESGVLISITASEADDSEPVRMIYRFDRDRPDTVDVTMWPVGRALSVPRELQHTFTTRARSASLLVVRVLHSRGEQDRYFDLAGSNRALGMLACVRDLRSGAARPPAARREPPVSAPKAPPLLPDRRARDAYELSAVEEVPSLVNRDDVVRALQRNYPPDQREAGTGGQVELRFRVLEDGSVDASSVTVVRSTNPVFDEPARQVAVIMRFKPARVNGRPVRVWVSVPIQFATSGP